MFINHTIGDGKSVLIEQFGRPIVYLDTWALIDISQDAILRERFTSIMSNRKGTLRLSASNLVELLKLTDDGQIESILSMIGSIDAGFINVNPKEVINRENNILADKPLTSNPSQELDLIYAYLVAHNWPEKWSISDVVRTVLENSSNDSFRQSYDQFALKMGTFIHPVRTDDEYLKKSKARSIATRKKGKVYDAATRELLQLGIDFIFQNKTMAMPAKEWHDFYHAIVPIAYCDIVLLDKRWVTFLSQTGLSFPDIALNFDRSSIEQFLYELASREFIA